MYYEPGLRDGGLKGRGFKGGVSREGFKGRNAVPCEP
jgi:hypothetical protein